jgi:protein-disulfide isomerase
MSKQQSSRRKRQESHRQGWQGKWLGILALAALLILIIYFTWQETGGSGGLSAAEVGDPALGPADAPVVITEYADFGCSACRAWHNYGIREQVLATFGDQVRFVWKDFPVITAQSPKAAEAGHCAADQGEFWAYHDIVYENFAGLNEQALRSYATNVGLDMERFDQCLADGLMGPKVRANEQEARQLGLRGTPGFAVNGRPLPAPPSYEQMDWSLCPC